jgi:pimeloyl-ACP methyl ester carboxylesterase
MADDYAGLIRGLDLGRVRIVGISMGGAIAQELALRHPDLVDRLVLVATWARCDEYTKEVFRHFAGVREAVALPDFVRLLQLWIWTPAYLNRNLAELREARQEQPQIPQPQHAYAAQCEACVSHDTLDRLGSIQVPTLITAGDADIFTPPALAEELAAGIPGATLKMFSGNGHAHHWEALDEFNRSTVEWLA